VSAFGLSDHEKHTLSSLLDEIIPPSENGRLPGAGSLGLTDYVEGALSRMPELEVSIVEGLRLISVMLRQQRQPAYAELTDEARRQVSSALEARVPTFLPALTFLAYSGYYSNARVLEALGLEARAPYPRGYEVPPTDFALLERVRRRGRRWREC
jgi:hypothetical protein